MLTHTYRHLRENSGAKVIGMDIALIRCKDEKFHSWVRMGTPDNNSSIKKTQKEEIKMKKVMIQLFIVSVVVTSYALPLLACGGAGP